MCLTLFGIMLNSAFYRDDTCPCCLFYFTLAIHSRKFRMAFVRTRRKKIVNVFWLSRDLENICRFCSLSEATEHKGKWKCPLNNERYYTFVLFRRETNLSNTCDSFTAHLGLACARMKNAEKNNEDDKLTTPVQQSVNHLFHHSQQQR